MSAMTPAMEAAALWGSAENDAYPLSERLACALKALDYFSGDGYLADRLLEIRTYNGVSVTPENLRWAATHESLRRAWIFDVLQGLADLVEREEES